VRPNELRDGEIHDTECMGMGNDPIAFKYDTGDTDLAAEKYAVLKRLA